MIANRNFEHCEPLTWVGQKPVYLATAIAAAHGVTMILTALGISLFGKQPVFTTFGFFPQAGLHFWQFITYAFVNEPGILAAFQIIMLAIFGSEVEKFLGRKSFAWLYALLILGLPVFLLVLNFFGWEMPAVGSNFIYPNVGSDLINFAVFVAFALIYPKAEIFFTLQARWIVGALLALYSLQMLASHAWIGLGSLWWECSIAAAWLMSEGVHTLPIPSWSAFWSENHSRKKLRVVPREENINAPDSIDPILEKIARQGMGSLTRAERDQLERARTALLEKERSG